MALKSVDDVEVGGFDDELSATEIAYLVLMPNFANPYPKAHEEESPIKKQGPNLFV